VAMLDIDMPGLNGIEVARQITFAKIKVGIIIVSMYDQDKYVLEAIKAGARGYLLKNSQSETLLRAIRRVAAGQAWLDPPIASKMVDEIRYLPLESSDIDPLTSLSPFELELLSLLAQGMTNEQIANHLDMSEKTVRNRLSPLFEKIGVKNRVQAVLYTLRQNLVDVNMLSV